jgi:NADH dehydrogenase [ubiquinone] 1 alpha subcomplex assembly factor 7
VTPLEAEIARTIAASGPITVAQFMMLCVGHPIYGYYRSRDPFGAAGDFVTAPEISQMFGELVGLWAACVWQQMGSPSPVHLVELGPGRGTLAKDALRAAAVVPEFRAAVRLDLVEMSPLLRPRQQAALADIDVPAAWHGDIAQVPNGPLIVVANEFFDALPVHQAMRAADGWHERVVGIDGCGQLQLALHPDPLPGFDAMIPPPLRSAPPGAIYEWRSDEPVLDLAERVVRGAGAALAIDYGHAESGLGATLQAVGRHRYVDLLDRPGEHDLTAHVDFAAFAAAAARAGARVWGPVPQGCWLRRLGIEARAARLKHAAPARAAEIDAAVERLAGFEALNMGKLFKAVAVAHPQLPPPPGFDQ